ncbi:MAG: hypothetical protein IAB99_06805 [Bacteroidetes bacterium]|uniref:Uncharacterized protein n=1 Tax=Candidatus Cryptobacteroides faecipullorum TaxID=2840764 RepID=A0A9D9I9F3_9BACT|nr:hypothetical protein [Candidatus Cryptobacteroides faecipullorum]
MKDSLSCKIPPHRISHAYSLAVYSDIRNTIDTDYTIFIRRDYNRYCLIVMRL